MADRDIRYDDPEEEIAAAFQVDSYEDIHPDALDHLAMRTRWQDQLAENEAERRRLWPELYDD